MKQGQQKGTPKTQREVDLYLSVTGTFVMQEHVYAVIILTDFTATVLILKVTFVYLY